MNATAKWFHDQHLQLAEQAERVGDLRRAEHHRRCALTYAAPIGNIIAQTYN